MGNVDEYDDVSTIFGQILMILRFFFVEIM